MTPRFCASWVNINDANTFFRDLRERVQTLERARRVNPRSIELTVASTKRFLGRLEQYRIELDELIAQEADRLLAQIDSSDLSGLGSWSQQEFRNRVSRYEAAAETVGRVVGVLGRWGNGSELQQMCDLVKMLHAHAERNQGGLVAWTNLRSYPAVLVATAYGLGLTREQRWNDLHRFLRFQIPRENRNPLPLVELYSTASWVGTEDNVFTNLDGLDHRKIALSDHLVDLLREWGKSFLGLSADHELTFERFEILESLAHFEQYDIDDLEAQKKARPNQQFTYCPIGRVAWRSSSFGILTQELGGEERKKQLFQAGFARGSERLLGLFLESLAYSAQWVNWRLSA